MSEELERLWAESDHRLSMDPPERLRNLRILAGLTQSRLAASLGVHRTTVARWETGRSPIPRWVELAMPRLVDAITAAS